MSKDDKLEIRARLLDAGLKVFAEKGFSGATVREICDEAGGNIAAINYYFGDKVGFYQAVREYARDAHVQAMRRCWSIAESDPWQAVRTHIEILLEQTFDSTMSRINWFRMRELIESTHPDAVFPPYRDLEAGRQQYEERISRLLSAILETAATPTNIALVRYTYYSLCLFLPIQTHIEERIFKGQARFSITAAHDRSFLADFIFNIVRRTVADLKTQAAVEKT
jgi:AcrR family transcriptional regulator